MQRIKWGLLLCVASFSCLTFAGEMNLTRIPLKKTSSFGKRTRGLMKLNMSVLAARMTASEKSCPISPVSKNVRSFFSGDCPVSPPLFEDHPITPVGRADVDYADAKRMRMRSTSPVDRILRIGR